MIDRTAGLPGTWEIETDVVVVGSGAAGLTAAVTAALQGAKVVLLEKASLVGGTTALSGGGVWIPANHHMPEVGVVDSPQEALSYLRAISAGAAEEVLLQALVLRGDEMVRYLEHHGVLRFQSYPSVGGTLDYRQDAPGAKHGGRPLYAGRVPVEELGDWADRIQLGAGSFSAVEKFDFYTKRLHTGGSAAGEPDAAPATPAAPQFANGTALIGLLLRSALAHGVEVHTDARADRLAVDAGAVVGVHATIAGCPTWVRARGGVVLASGGFEYNDGLKRAFLNRPLELSCGVPTNEGDGLVMGMAIGAQLSNTADAWWQAVASVPDEHGRAVSVHVRGERANPHAIMVNRAGRRFVNEATNYYDVHEAFGTKQNGTPNLPAWLIVDQQFRDRYPMLAGAPATTSDGAPAWLVSAPSLQELAERVGIDPAGLVATVEEFNRHAREGNDPLFGRGEGAWDREWGDPTNLPNPSLGTLEAPPFHAVELHAGAMGTKGGLRINERAEVLAAGLDDLAIPGLYAAGNTSAGAVPHGYAGPGATIGPAMTFGYVAGRESARRAYEECHRPVAAARNAG